MKSFEYDLGYIQAGLEVVESFLLSDEVFWPLSGNPPEGAADYPRLTLGGLLLAHERLAAYPMTYPQKAQFQRVILDMEHVRSKWRVAWETKAGHSFSVRLRMWRDFIEDYQNSPQDNADRYVYEVRRRVMLKLLKSEGGGLQDNEVDLLSGLDGYLKSVLEMDEFIWEARIQTGFPKDVYWYLYGNLPPKPKKP